MLVREFRRAEQRVALAGWAVARGAVRREMLPADLCFCGVDAAARELAVTIRPKALLLCVPQPDEASDLATGASTAIDVETPD